VVQHIPEREETEAVTEAEDGVTRLVDGEDDGATTTGKSANNTKCNG
jgi:hypothetical protein